MAVADIIEDQQEFATDSIASADTFLSQLANLASTQYFLMGNAPVEGIPEPGYAFDDTQVAIDLVLGFFPDTPTIADIAATAPTFTPEEVDDLADVPVADFTKVAPELDFPLPPSTALPSVPTAPSLSDPVLPTAPTVTLPAVPVVTGPTLPDVPAIETSVSLPTPPTVATDIDLPDAPEISTSLTLPTAPTITAIVLPEPPSVEIPAFTATAPLDDLVAPTSEFTFNEVAYQSALLDALTAKLLTDLEDGGYGIETADESAMFDRARTRELEAARAEQETMIADFAGRGWALPPGELTVVLQRSQQNLQNRMAGVNREITLKRADMFVENRKFTIQEVRQLETTLIGYHNSVMERSLNAAKAVVEMSVAIFNAQVARYNARVAAYGVEAQVFEARIRGATLQTEIYRVQMEGKRIEAEIERVRIELYRAQLEGAKTEIEVDRNRIELYRAQLQGELARLEVQKGQIDVYRAQLEGTKTTLEVGRNQVELYKAQVDGSRAVTEVQKAQVDIYNAQVNGQQTVVALYTARMNAARVQAEIEQVRMQGFRALIESYVAQVQAKVAEFNMFESRIKGETAKVQAYQAEVQAYTATVEGAKAKADIAIARLEGQIKEQAHRIAVFQAEIAAYQSDIDAQAKTIAARTQVFGAQVQGASAKAGAVTEAYRLELTQKDLEFRRNAENARILLAEAQLSLQAALGSANARTAAGGAAAGYYQALIGAAVNSINTLTGLIATE